MNSSALLENSAHQQEQCAANDHGHNGQCQPESKFHLQPTMIRSSTWADLEETNAAERIERTLRIIEYETRGGVR
jgi:hypothetical protein